MNKNLQQEMKEISQEENSENKNIFLNPEEQRSEDLLIKDALFVRHEGSLVKLKHVDILWLKGDGNYTTIVARNSVFSVRNLLKDFEDVLPPDQYIRIHKSYIARIDEINSINTREIKVGQDLVPVGRTYYHNLVDRIQKLSPSGD
jgi:DNA-binding LytR/AlgR family response regulator